MRGDFGFASGAKNDSGYSRVWFNELLPPEEISFDSDVYLLLNKTAQELKKSNGRLAVVETPVAVTAPSDDHPEAGPLHAGPAAKIDSACSAHYDSASSRTYAKTTILVGHILQNVI